MKIGNVEIAFDITGLAQAKTDVVRALSSIRQAFDSINKTPASGGAAASVDDIGESAKKAESEIAELGRKIRAGAFNGLVGSARAAGQALQLLRSTSVSAMSGVARAIKGAGDASFRSIISGARQAGDALNRLRGSLGSIGGRALTVGGVTSVLGGLGAGFGVGAAMDETQQLIVELERMSKVLDLPMEKMSAFNSYARRYGLELDDLRGALIGFYGVAGEARIEEGSYRDLFLSLGIDMTEAKNAGADVVELLTTLGEKVRLLDGSQKTSILSQIFGDEDSSRIAALMDQLAFDGIAGFSEHVSRMHDAMSLITDQDVAAMQEFREASEDVNNAVRGLQLSLYRAFGGDLADLMRTTSGLIIEYRKQIVDTAKTVWNFVAGLAQNSFGTIRDVASAAATAVREFMSGLTATNLTESSTRFEKIGFAIASAAGWMFGLVENIARVVSGSGEAGGSFSWINDVIAGVQAVSGDLGGLVEWLVSVGDAVNFFLEPWGFDLSTSALFVGILGASGLLGPMVGMLGLLGGLAPTLLIVAGIVTATAAAIIAMRAPVEWLVNKLMGTEAHIERMVAQADASLDMYGIKTGTSVLDANSPAGLAAMQAARDNVANGNGKPTQRVEFILPDGTTAAGDFVESEWDTIRNNAALSVTGGRY